MYFLLFRELKVTVCKRRKRKAVSICPENVEEAASWGVRVGDPQGRCVGGSFRKQIKVYEVILC